MLIRRWCTKMGYNFAVLNIFRALVASEARGAVQNLFMHYELCAQQEIILFSYYITYNI